MGITVLKNNVPWGPFTRAQIDEGLERGDFDLSTLAHASGMTGWLPLEEVIHNLDPALPPVPVKRDLPPIPSPAALARTRPPVLPAPMQGDLVLPKLPPLPSVAETSFRPAPFIPRTFAFLIDCAILLVPIAIIMLLSAASLELKGWWESADPESMRQQWVLWNRHLHELLFLVALGLGWIYGAGFECSRWQATIGKRWMGLKVTDVHGERLSFLRASGRLAGKYLSALPCFLGFISALFSSRGLAWHDRLADTWVVRRQEKP